MNCPVIIHTFFVKASTDNAKFLDLLLVNDRIALMKMKRNLMSRKNEKVDINQYLKWELYGRLAACGIMAAILVVATGIQYRKNQTKNVKHAVEQVENIKSGVTDSISRRSR